ncbi:BtaA family protein [Crocinitomicaceae bacterium]|nr:BtaA family protein [Crocinitomicaceae bacterium]
MKEQLDNVQHDYIRYANCWEDADVLLEGLQIKSGDRVLSIGSAGDNSFSLLSEGPELVVAVDINPVQLSLIELKKAAFATLEYQEFLEFLGFKPSSRRLELFEKVKTKLSDELQKFWIARQQELADGVIYQGKFERYFKLFRRRILPLVHPRKRVDRLFEEKSSEDQASFFHKKWNNRRWRLLFKLFFSKFVMGRFGRDPAFLKEVDVVVSEFILGQAAAHLSHTNAQNNYFLHFIMKGDFGDQLPHYAREENFGKIKSNLDRLVVFNGLAEAAFAEYQNFSKFNLSNIFEYMPQELFLNVAQNLVDNSVPNARFAYWNLMVPRKINTCIDGIENESELTKTLTKQDNGFFYMGIQIDKRDK